MMGEKDSLVTPDRVLNVLFFPQELMCVDLVDSVIVPVSYSKQSGKSSNGLALSKFMLRASQERRAVILLSDLSTHVSNK